MKAFGLKEFILADEYRAALRGWKKHPERSWLHLLNLAVMSHPSYDWQHDDFLFED